MDDASGLRRKDRPVDEQRFNEMALAELDRVYRMARHLTRDADEANDLVQETYLKAFRSRHTFELRDAEKGLRPWLLKILHNNFYDRKNQQNREPTIADDLAPLSVASELDSPPPAWDLSHLDWEQVDERLKQAIDQLPAHYREVLLLWAVEGLKYREIAEVQSLAVGTVMSRLYRARSILSRDLATLAQENGIAVDTLLAEQAESKDNG
jgi:RNA polymerase sigma-70 factor (ECF subfamily)